MPRTRKSGDGGLYFDKKRELWIGVVDNGFTPDGKRKQVRVTSKSQSVARTKLRAKIDEIEKYGSPLGNRKVAEWGAFWLSEQKAKMKPGAYRAYASVMKTWVLPRIGGKNLKEVRPSDLQMIYRDIRAKRTTATALKAHNVMSSMFEAARLERLVSINVARDVQPPRAEETDRGALPPEETVKVLAAATRARQPSKWLVSLYAGIRQGERCGATLDSVDFEKKTFTVRWNLVEANWDHGCDPDCGRKAGWCPQRRLVVPEGMPHRLLGGRLLLVPPKSGKPRTFPLPDSLLAVLQQDVNKLTSNPHGLLWPASDGSPMTGRADQAEWKSLVVDAEIERPEATSHWARHTAITDFAAEGVPDRVIGAIVGHASPGVTGRYVHVSSKDEAQAMERMGERRQIASGSDTHPS